MSLSLTLSKIIHSLPSRVKIGSRYIGQGEPVYCIAEVGNNHNGELELAKKTILAAKEAGAEAVKFQKRNVAAVFTKEMREMAYDNPRSLAPTYGEHREKLEFTKEQFLELKKCAEDAGMVMFVTPFDLQSADFLEDIGVHAYKISSFDVTNIPLLKHVAKKGKPILLSTGMATLEEMDTAIQTILEDNKLLIVNHCVSIYPTPDDQLDLSMIQVLKDRYAPLPIGYSGHEPDFLASVVSVGLGACAVERHFTLDKTMRGSDHHMSIEPQEFKAMVDSIRRVEKSMGTPEKYIHDAEVPIRAKHGKSIVAKVDIEKGTKITMDMLTFKSPGSGIKPIEVDHVVGRIAKERVNADTVVPVEALTW